MGFKKLTFDQPIINGAMAGTSVLLSNRQSMDNLDNAGLEVTWTGTPTGTLAILGSNSDINYYALTFNPPLTQPAGAGGGYLIDLNQFPFRYLKVQYTNASGSGTLNVFFSGKDLN